jgi:hypothetical protein
MTDTTVYDETLDPELAELVAAAECIDLRPLDMRRACDVLDRVEHETRFPRQRRNSGPAPRDGGVVIPATAVSSVEGWECSSRPE